MSFPCIKINLNKIAGNAELINGRCVRSGISVVGVTKSILADIKITKILKKSGIRIFGDSRLLNLQKLRNYFGYGQKLILLRTPMISECETLVEICDESLQTEPETVRVISEICKRKKINHNIIIMIETDDRREGIYPSEAIAFFDEAYRKYRNIKVTGLGTNARCLSKRKPALKSIDYLIRLRDRINKLYGYKIPIISGGNSSLWKYIEAGMLPEEVNQVRIGEAIFIGNETSNYEVIKEAHSDCFILEAEVIEVKEKKDKIYKAILALGVQDVNCKNLKIKNPFYEIIGQSSDHTVIGLKKECVNNYFLRLDLPEDESFEKEQYNKKDNFSRELKVGSIVRFGLDYFGLLSCMTSPFVEKKYV
ncbi:MAG: alanine racemase [Actinobacteria bacterium]|nr:alanine racemase [Actinomycetota bacterium]